MEGANKKRKICHDHEDHEDEEQKIEKFFALIKNIREIRDRLVLKGSNAFMSGTENKKNQIMKVKAGKQIAVWKPSFQLEDFMERAPLFNCPPHHVTFLGSAQGEEEEARKEITEEGLDLTLSL